MSHGAIASLHVGVVWATITLHYNLIAVHSHKNIGSVAVVVGFNGCFVGVLADRLGCRGATPIIDGCIITIGTSSNIWIPRIPNHSVGHL